MVHSVCSLLKDTCSTCSKINSIELILFWWQQADSQQGKEGRKEEEIFLSISSEKGLNKEESNLTGSEKELPSLHLPI